MKGNITEFEQLNESSGMTFQNHPGLFGDIRQHDTVAHTGPQDLK